MFYFLIGISGIGFGSTSVDAFWTASKSSPKEHKGEKHYDLSVNDDSERVKSLPAPNGIQIQKSTYIRLDVYFSKDEGVAYAQVFDFCNYACEPATDVVELHNPKADILISQL